MVLDPFSALGLASNIVQFIDFACTLVSGSRKIYKSSSGSSDNTQNLTAVAQHLKSLTAELTVSTDKGTTNVGSTLRAIAFECQKVAQELQDVVETLEVKGKKTVWKSFLVALSEVWKSDQVARLTGRINALQKNLNSHLLILLRNQQSELRVALDDIDERNKTFEMNRVQQLQKLKQELLGAVDRLRDEQELSTTKIRSYFESMRNIEVVRVQSGPQLWSEELRFKSPIDAQDAQILAGRMNELAQALSNVAMESRTVVSEQILLQSLFFESMTDRHGGVRKAHAKTFEWIYENDGDSTNPHHFVDWLREQNGIFWISGKPGSGKSTLMKFLCANEETAKHLNEWAGDRKLIIAKYFFWYGGKKLQKSQAGLFRTILFEILRQEPNLISRVCPNYSRFAPYQVQLSSWTRDDLVSSFRALGDMATFSNRFCVFIDGLDEYDASEEGDFTELAQVLKKISDCPDIKICVASRPENEFRDAFGNNTSRCLKMQDHTENDIRQFVHNCFFESPRFQQEQLQDNRYNGLIDQIVSESQGVFLWVHLAVKSLLQGITNADRPADLQNRLKKLPKTLEEYFQHMLDSVEDDYKESTAIQIQVALDAVRPLSLITVWLLETDSTLTELSPNVNVAASIPTDLNRIEDVMSRRLQARCKGLLEMTFLERNPKDGQVERILRTRVDFLHRTVRDYLLQAHMQKILQDRMPVGFNARLNICQALTAHLKATPTFSRSEGHTSALIAEVLADLMLHSLRVEQESERLTDALESVLDSADMILAEIQKHSSGNAFLGLAVEYGLLFYVSAKLKGDPSLVHNKQSPLLIHALCPRNAFNSEVRLEMVRTLLKFQANLNEKCDKIPHDDFDHPPMDEKIPSKISIWHQYMHDIRFGPRPLQLQDSKKLYQILLLLVKAGADLREKLHIQTRYLRPSESGRAGDLYRGSGKDLYTPIYETGEQIIRYHLSAEDVARLVAVADGLPKKKKGFIHWLRPRGRRRV